MTVFICFAGALLALAIGIDGGMTMLGRCDLTMTIFRCAGGAFLGLAIGMVVSWLLLDKLAQSWEVRLSDPTNRLPAPLNDTRRVGALILWVMPLVFASVGAATAYYLCMTGAL